MAGFKLWSVGDALTAADLNGYLSYQVVPRFTTVANRDIAFPSPTPGIMARCADTGELYVYSGLSSSWVSAVPRVRFKTADKTITSSTTLATDTDFATVLEASSYYIMDFAFYLQDGGSGDIKFQHTYSGTAASSRWNMLFMDITNLSSTSTNLHLDNLQMIGSATAVGTLNGNLTFAMGSARFTTTTSGTYNLQWAQNTSDAGGTSLKSGSFIAVQKVK